MNELLQTILSTLLTPIAFGLVVGTAWLLRHQIRALIEVTGLTKIGVTKEGAVTVEFDVNKFAEKTYSKQGMGSPSPEDVNEVAILIQSLSSFVAGRRILWVDNHPENNRLERSALVRWGVKVQTRRTTEDALAELRNVKDTPFDLVISDWFRGGQPEGQKLAELMRTEKLAVPILFYFSVDRSGLFNEILDKVKALQAVGATSSPRELLRWVFAELVRASLRDKQTSFRYGSLQSQTITRSDKRA